MFLYDYRIAWISCYYWYYFYFGMLSLDIKDLLFRISSNDLIPHSYYVFTTKASLGFEFASWYWHFVDVVWLYVFTFLYWWGSL